MSHKISDALADLSKRVAAMERQAVEDAHQTARTAVLMSLLKSACDELQRSYDTEADAAEAYGVGDLIRNAARCLHAMDPKAHRKWAVETLENWPEPKKKKGSK